MIYRQIEGTDPTLRMLATVNVHLYVFTVTLWSGIRGHGCKPLSNDR